MIYIHILIRIRGQIALDELFRDQPPQRRIYHDEHRHSEEHSPEPEQAAAEDDGEHDPEAVDADGAAEDLRADDVAVELLKHDDEYHEYQAL